MDERTRRPDRHRGDDRESFDNRVRNLTWTILNLITAAAIIYWALRTFWAG